MPYLVDGDNLLGTWPGRRRSDAEKRALAMEIARLGAREGKRFVVAFDGEAAEGLHFGAGVRFSGAGRSADDLILEILRQQKDRRGWVVVTSDHSLGDQCRWLEARVERCDRFRGRIGSSSDAEKPERETDIDFWLEQFSGDE